MPQLNPEPWFQIFILSWVTLLMIVLPLILARTEANQPESQTIRFLPEKKSWTWPWL